MNAPATQAPAGFASAPAAESWFRPSAVAAFLAGGLTAYTISVGGEMPVGEIVLALVAAWVVVCAFVHQASPGPLLRRRYFWVLLAAQLVAFAGYVVSDLYRHSRPHDMARGWSRMVFLAIDIVAVTYLLGRSRRNFVAFVLGQCAGDLSNTVLFGPLFGDVWKFGVGAPLTFLLLWIAPLGGPWTAAAAATALGVVHLALGYRSLGGLCLVAGALGVLQGTTRRSRPWLAPLGVLAVAGVIGWVYAHARSDQGERVTRSDVERTAMLDAATAAIERSPLIGHGSWFSNSDVYDNFLLIRQQLAREAHVGGFWDPAEDPETTALHSQILVAVAEGGLFGGAFFFVFGAGLVRTLWRLVFCDRWHRLAPLAILVLLSALWNLGFSPFSGAHRVYIALACGLMLLHQSGRLAPAAPEAANDEAV
jgi:hypothetical protein